MTNIKRPKIVNTVGLDNQLLVSSNKLKIFFKIEWDFVIEKNKFLLFTHIF